MKRLRKLIAIVCVCVVAALVIGLGSHSFTNTKVKPGFYFGPPEAQQRMEFEGTYSVNRWGFPATYREVEKFQATNGAKYETSYVSKPLNPLLVIANIVLLMSFLVALLAPVTIFWRPKKLSVPDVKKSSETKLTEEKMVSQAKKDANIRD